MEKERRIDWEKLAVTFVRWIGVVLFLMLSVMSLLFTRSFPKIYQEIPVREWDCFPLTLAAALAFAALLGWIGKQLCKVPEKAERNVKILLTLMTVWIVAVGVIFCLLAKCIPVADQMMVGTSAERFAQGDFGRFDYGKYLYYYPFQLGITVYEEMVFRVFGANSYLVLKLLNVLMVALGLWAGYGLTRELFSDLKISIYFVLLYSFCFPLIVYSNYIYGDVLAVCLSLISIWQMLRYVKRGKKSGLLFFIIAMSAAVVIRNNCLIVLIACCCILFVKLLAERKGKYLLCLLLVTVCALGSGKVLKKIYEHRSGMEINEGMPSVLWIAMGMQEGDKEAGWYNGYSIYIYQDVCAYEEKPAAEIGIGEIKTRIKGFLKDPLYAVDFYSRKFASQWDDPTYCCFVMTNESEGRGEWGEQLYTGKIHQVLESWMNVYQFLIYGSILVLLLRKKEQGIDGYVLLIAVIGGVLFHLMWEAKSRYVLPYFIMMLPMAAAGVAEFSLWIKERRTKNKI